MLDNIYNTLLLLGAIQAFIMTIMLWLSKNMKLANRFLAVMTISWAVSCLIFSIQSREFWDSYPHLFKVGSIFTSAFFPPIYLYAKYVTTGRDTLKKLDLLHFLPSLSYALASIPFYILSADEKRSLLFNYEPASLYAYNDYVASANNIIIILQGTVYTVLALMILNKYNSAIRESFSNIDKLTFNWLRNLVWLNFVLWTIGTAGAIFDLTGEQDLPFFEIYYMSVVLVIYFITYYALKQPDVFNELRGAFVDRSEVDEDMVTESERLIVVMKQKKPYVDTQLTLNTLSEMVEIPRNRLSTVIKQGFDKNFFDFINDWRVDEVKGLLDDDETNEYKLEYLANKAGFNSKASFNRIFKAKTGQTPTEYRANS